MKLRTISAIAMFVSAVYASPSMAFTLPSIPGVGSGNSGSSAASVNVDALTKQQAELLVAMTTSLRNLANSQEMMASALGLDQEAAKAKKSGEGLASGTLTGKDDMEKMIDSSVEVAKAIKDKLANAGQLDANAKAQFAKSLVPYGAGTVGLAITGKKAADAAQSLTHTMDPTILTKLSSLLYVAKETPTLASTFSNATSQIVAYATSQGIDTSAIKKAGAGLGD
ncbi:hypothetical protein SB861_41985 [Paraburkholderia sp. SIMBA_049]